MRSNQRDILEQRVKFIARRRDALVKELEELDVEAQEIVIALRVLDRYAIRLAGTKGKTTKDEPEEEEEEAETPAPAPEAPAEPETPPSDAGPAENGIYKPLAEALEAKSEPAKTLDQKCEEWNTSPATVEMGTALPPLAKPNKVFVPVTKPLTDEQKDELAKRGLEGYVISPPLARPEPFNVRKKREPLPPVEQRLRANFRKPVIPARQPVSESYYRKYGTKEPGPETIPPKDETLERIAAHKQEPEAPRLDMRTIAGKQAKVDSELHKGRNDGTYNKDTSGQEPPPAWRGKRAEPSNVYTVDIAGKSLALAGSYLMFDGKMVKSLDKWQQSVIITLMKNHPEQTLRVEIKGMVKDIDRTIGNLRGIMALTEAKIETTHGGWKLCQRSGDKT